MEKDIKSVYIHIPFCSNICSYCDFAKMFYNHDMVLKYLKALEKEINEKYQNELIETLYIGGGTPSCLNIDELKVLFAIIKKINLSKNLEFTFECNVNDITEEKIAFLSANGVNRISLGVQTFNEEILKNMHRSHNYEEVKSKISLIKKYINNINVDLIYAYPNMTIDILNDDLEKFLSLNVDHISTYSLIIEPHTLLSINNVSNINEDLDYLMYKTIIEKLTQNGFKHYEISNFARNNRFSKHNLTYWNNLEYYGFGLNASGYMKNIRYTNTRSMSNYLASIYESEKEIITKKDKIIYELILGLRKIDGIDLDNFKIKYNIELEENKLIKNLLKENKLEIKNRKLKIPYQNIYVENEVLVELLDYE